jgi:glutamine synthetase adenylyltransferase
VQQKEQEIQRQTGTSVKLDPASDPEFAKALAQHMQRLQAQYNQVIDQAKEQLQGYL